MKTLWLATERLRLFLKWLVIPYGTTKVHPAMGVRYLPGGTLAGDIVEGKLTRWFQEQECEICGVKCWKWRKNAPPICTTWPCYKAYYTKEKGNGEQNTNR